MFDELTVFGHRVEVDVRDPCTDVFDELAVFGRRVEVDARDACTDVFDELTSLVVRLRFI